MEEIKEQLAKIEQMVTLSAKNVLTIDDVVLITGIKKSYLYRLTAAHQIPYYKPNGKSIYFKKSEIEEYLTKNRVNTISESENIAGTYNLI